MPAQWTRVNGDTRCSTAVEPTSARRGELVGLTEASRASAANEPESGTSIPHRLTCAGCSTSSAWIGRHAVARGFGKRRSLPEAAHVPSEYLTEPMRCLRRRPQLAPLSMRRSLARPQGSGSRRRQRPALTDRARRFAWPARGTERFLGRRGVPGCASGRAIAEAACAWEHASARPRIAVWCRLGIVTDKRNSEPRTIPAQMLADSRGVC